MAFEVIQVSSCGDEIVGYCTASLLNLRDSAVVDVNMNILVSGGFALSGPYLNGGLDLGHVAFAAINGSFQF